MKAAFTIYDAPFLAPTGPEKLLLLLLLLRKGKQQRD